MSGLNYETNAPEQSGHWYYTDGTPAYTVIGANGRERGTTLADARKLNLAVSVTTVLNIIAKPQLTSWMVDQGILAALTLERKAGESDKDYLRRVKDDSKQQAIAAAQEGTRIHDACEAALQGRDVAPKYQDHVTGALGYLRMMFPGVDDWIAEKSFGHPSGYGGKVDVHSPSTGIVVDFKGKEGDFSDGKRLAYDQNLQLAAYQDGLRLPRNKCANIFISRTHPGKVANHIWTVDEIEQGSRIFKATLDLWKLIKGYAPTTAPGELK